jgi:predicted nucleic acid-binding protein
MILVDTSVWVRHLRHHDERLANLLREELVACHPFVIGELACGNLSNRKVILTLLQALPQAQKAEYSEVMHLIESRRLFGRGLGWVDAHLLSSTLISKCVLWTLDKRLASAATELRIASPV